MATFIAVPWTTGDIITEVKLDNMVSNSQSEDAHAANGMIMNNNVPYRAKQAGGTTKDVMKLGTDDILRLSQLRYQSDTTNSTKENIMIETGWGFIPGASAAQIEETVSFPTAFTTILAVYITSLGGKAGSDPTSVTDTIATAKVIVHAHSITTSQFDVRIATGDGSNLSATIRYAYAWQAWGIKS